MEKKDEILKENLESVISDEVEKILIYYDKSSNVYLSLKRDLLNSTQISPQIKNFIDLVKESISLYMPTINSLDIDIDILIINRLEELVK